MGEGVVSSFEVHPYIKMDINRHVILVCCNSWAHHFIEAKFLRVNDKVKNTYASCRMCRKLRQLELELERRKIVKIE